MLWMITSTTLRRPDVLGTAPNRHLLAVYDQDRSKRSGLGQTLNYAIKKDLRITFIHPDTAEAIVHTADIG